MIKSFKDSSGFTSLFLVVLIVIGWFLIKYPKGFAIIYFDGFSNDYLDIFFRYITMLGEGVFYGLVVIFILSVRSYYCAVTGIISGISISAVSLICKRLIFSDAIRPLAYFEGLYGFHAVENVTLHSHYSFPSGHTLTAFSVFLLLTLTHKNAIFGIIYFVVALLVGVSRIYLKQHFLEDVYFGMIIGVVVTFIVYVIMQKSGLQNVPWAKKKLFKS